MIQNQSATSAEPVPNRYLTAAMLGREFLDDYRGEYRATRRSELLEAIYELVIDRCAAHETLDASFLSFSPTEIVEAMGTSKADSSDPTQNGKKVTGWWEKGRVQDDLRTGLESQAKRNGLNYIPWIEKDAGGGHGRTSSYRFTIQEIDAKAERVSDESVPDGWIRYYRESARRPTFAPLVNRPLGGLRSKVMLGILLPLLAVAAFFSYWGAIQLLHGEVLGSVQDIAMGMLAAALIYLLSGHLYRSREMGIVVAGLFTSPFNDDEPTQLVSEYTEEGRQVLLVKFYSQCEVPGCGGRVTVRNGRNAERGRLIGCCEQSPREHVYTFDHVTELGCPMRTAAALGDSRR